MYRLIPLIVLLVACGESSESEMDLQSTDGPLLADSGATDLGELDSALPDAELPDAELPDAELPDAELPDAALPDAAFGAVIEADEPKAYSEGACPELLAGPNEFDSAGLTRNVEVFLPRDPTGARVLFVWHHLGGNASDTARFFQAAATAQQRELIIVVPESRRLRSEWGYVGNEAAPDLALFDDLLSCLDEQFGVDRQQVFTTGFSAGALWSSYLVMHRAAYLAGAVIMSGGFSPLFATYETPAYPLPVVLAWGGPNDTFGGIINFQDTSIAFRDALLEDGHFVATCEHTGRHSPPPDVANWGYDFLDAHSVRDGQSPYAESGLPDTYPDFCQIAE